MAIIAALSIIALGLIVWAYGVLSRARTGVPAGQVIYSDTGIEEERCDTLYSDRYMLVGRPDYLVRCEGEIRPIEVKSMKMPRSGPYTSHVMQLAAYCLLVEENFGCSPTCGLIRYADETVRVNYDGDLRRHLIETINQVRRARELPLEAVHRSHNREARCRGCSYRAVCNEFIERAG
jgi:CRISPR-associated exonuclease Cas4